MDALFPIDLTDPEHEAPLGAHHEAFWDWVWEDKGEVGRPPFCGFWPRGGAKSTNVERAVTALGGRGHRHYCLYVCGIQEQADDHVANIGTILESPRFEKYYPELAHPAVNKFGSQRGWRRNRLLTAGNFFIDALGLDTASTRGIKIDDYRPDLIIIDDIDGDFDTKETTDKKVRLLQKKILPAGARNLMVIFIQNLISPNSVAARLAGQEGADKVDLLHRRVVSGPFKALENFEYRERSDGGFDILSGTPIWEGQGLEVCQAYIDIFGIGSFLSECQNEVEVPAGGVFSDLNYLRCEWSEVPRDDLERGAVWLDPAVTSTDQSDCQGIQADVLALNGRIYRLYSWEGVQKPETAVKRAILKAVELSREFGISFDVGIETDQGGDTWESVYREALRALRETGQIGPFEAPAFKSEKAGAGYGPKLHRGQQQVAMYERGLFIHVRGTATVLERSQRRFGKVKPFDLVDAGYWSAVDLLGRSRKIGATSRPVKPGPSGAFVAAVQRGYLPEG